MSRGCGMTVAAATYVRPFRVPRSAYQVASTNYQQNGRDPVPLSSLHHSPPRTVLDASPHVAGSVSLGAQCLHLSHVKVQAHVARAQTVLAVVAGPGRGESVRYDVRDFPLRLRFFDAAIVCVGKDTARREDRDRLPPRLAAPAAARLAKPRARSLGISIVPLGDAPPGYPPPGGNQFPSP